jgi:hypothetical protein
MRTFFEQLFLNTVRAIKSKGMRFVRLVTCMKKRMSNFDV